MTNDVYRDLLTDFSFELTQLSRTAALDAQGAREDEFKQGYLSAHHRIVSLLQQQIDSFGISGEKLHISSIDPDSDLT